MKTLSPKAAIAVTNEYNMPQASEQLINSLLETLETLYFEHFDVGTDKRKANQSWDVKRVRIN